MILQNFVIINRTKVLGKAKYDSIKVVEKRIEKIVN